MSDPYYAGKHSDYKPEEAGLIIAPDLRPVDKTIVDSDEIKLLKLICDKLGIPY